jgi:hypothetical protein
MPPLLPELLSLSLDELVPVVLVSSVLPLVLPVLLVPVLPVLPLLPPLEPVLAPVLPVISESVWLVLAVVEVRAPVELVALDVLPPCVPVPLRPAPPPLPPVPPASITVSVPSGSLFVVSAISLSSFVRDAGKLEYGPITSRYRRRSGHYKQETRDSARESATAA